MESGQGDQIVRRASADNSRRDQINGADAFSASRCDGCATSKTSFIRHGHCLPDTDDVDIFLFQAAYCYLHFMWRKTCKKPTRTALRERLSLWCERWAPDSSILTQDLVVRDVLQHPRFDNADDCAGHLRLSLEERRQLRITTIGVFGMSKHQRAKLRNRIKAERRRRRHGAVPRTEYLANSLSRTQPWRVLGISRATWFRHRETGVHPASVS
jgi:hypothetical protein